MTNENGGIEDTMRKITGIQFENLRIIGRKGEGNGWSVQIREAQKKRAVILLSDIVALEFYTISGSRIMAEHGRITNSGGSTSNRGRHDAWLYDEVRGRQKREHRNSEISSSGVDRKLRSPER